MIRRLFRIGMARRDVDRDIDEELDFHFRRTVETLRASGMEPAEAEAEARRRFGDVEAYRSRLATIDRGRARAGRLAEARAALGQALVFAFRGLRRSPGFAAAVVLTLALGIGANATMFGVADRLLLSPPDHVADAHRVARLMVSRISPFTARPVVSSALTWPDLRDFRDVDAFESVSGFTNRTMTLGSGAGAEKVRVQWAGGELFGLLGTRPYLGRFFGSDEDAMDATTRPAVLAHGFWRRRFGGDPDVAGTEIHLGQERYTVVGVAPAGFTGPTLQPVDLWIPLLPAAVAEQGRNWEEARRWYWLEGVARLREDATREAARAEATAAHRAGRSVEVTQGRYDADASVVLGSLVAGSGPDPSEEVAVSRWLVGVSLLVLLIACANVANLQLARGLRRRRELAVRMAMGIGHGRLLGHLLLESLLLAALAGAAALAVARWGGALVFRTLLPDVDPGTALSGPGILLFTGSVVLLTTVLVGLVPALRSSRPDVTRDLKEGGEGSASSGRLRRGLLIFQVALSTILLVGAGLFVRSLERVYALELGFQPRGVVQGSVETAEGAWTAGSARIVAEAAEALRGAPGIEGAAVTSLAPFHGLWGKTLLLPPGDTVAFERGPYYYVVTADYFDVVGMRILRGRGLRDADESPGAEPVTVVTEDLARGVFGTTDVVGRCVLVEQREGIPPCTRVVGVLADHRIAELDDPESPVFYVTPSHPASVDTPPQTLVARSAGPTASLVARVRRALLDAGSDVRYASVAPLAGAVDAQARSWRLGATLFLIFGGLALGVALVGLYALVTFDVAQRRTELGIRAALGAPPGRLATAVVTRAVGLAALGTVAGLGLAMAAGPALGHLLFRVDPRDPVILGLVAASLLGVAAVATVAPAWRAARVDPRDALRSE